MKGCVDTGHDYTRFRQIFIVEEPYIAALHRQSLHIKLKCMTTFSACDPTKLLVSMTLIPLGYYWFGEQVSRVSLQKSVSYSNNTVTVTSSHSCQGKWRKQPFKEAIGLLAPV